jgi:hypothetical protein
MWQLRLREIKKRLKSELTKKKYEMESYLHYKLRKFTFMCEVFLNRRGEA